MESFGLLAEVGVALAGFSGVAIAIGDRSSDLNRLTRWRNSNLLQCTLGVTFGSLAVAFFETLGFEGAALWRASSLAFLPIALSIVVVPPLSLRRIPKSERVHFSNAGWYLSLSLGGLAAVTQLVNALGLLGTPAPGPLFGGLLALLVAGTSQFFRILVGISERPAA